MKNNEAKNGKASLQPQGGGKKPNRRFFLEKTGGLSGFLGQEFSASLGLHRLLLLLLVIHHIPFGVKSRFPSLGLFHPKLSSIPPSHPGSERAGEGNGHVLPDVALTSAPAIDE